MENAKSIYMKAIEINEWLEKLSPEAYAECVGVLLYRIWLREK